MARKETIAVKSGVNHLNHPRPVATPIYLSSTYVRNEDGTYNDGFVYTRAGNPNRATLEQSLAQLEGGEVAFAFGSGMAAISAVLQTLKAGDHLIIPDDAYFALPSLVEKVFQRWGLEVSKADMTDLKVLANTFKPNTRMVWTESPSNPQLKIIDIQAVANLSKEHETILVVDNTWPTPIHQNPLLIGADIVVHSNTKYLGGHSDVLGGSVIFRKQSEWADRVKEIQELGGAVPAPFDCWLVARGLQTLPVRVKSQSESALKLAQWFTTHPKIERVLYPGLVEHPGHDIARKQMHNGFGGMLSILIKENVKKILEISNRLQYFTTATSLGGVESLVEHRKSVEGESSPTPDNLLRISVGLEHIDDLIEDWERALK